MKTKLLLLLAFLCLFLGSNTTASAQDPQPPMQDIPAPNYYWANPSIYKWRVKQISFFNGESSHNFRYDDRGRLVRRETKDKDGFISLYNEYFYDASNYLVQMDTYTLVDPTSGVYVLTDRDHFYRNDLGLILYTMYWNNIAPSTKSIALIPKFGLAPLYTEKSQIKAGLLDHYFAEERKFDVILKTFAEYQNDQFMGTQHYNLDNTPAYQETLTYNNSGKISSLKFKDFQEDKTVTFSYVYNEQGDIINSGRADFPRVYTHDKEKLAKETFVPFRESTYWLTFGYRNWDGIEFTNSVHAIATINTDEVVYTYEANSGPSNATTINQQQKSLQAQFIDNQLQVIIPQDAKGETIRLFSAAGELLVEQKANNTIECLTIGVLQQGVYLVSLGEYTTKLQY